MIEMMIMIIKIWIIMSFAGIAGAFSIFILYKIAELLGL